MAALHKMASAIWTFVIVATLLSQYPVSCLDNNVPQCPAEYQCSCTVGNRDYEVECPFTENSSISAHYIDDTYAYVQCTNMMASDYNKLPTFSIPNHQDGTKAVSFIRCPLPQVPLADVIQKLGCPKGSSKLKSVFFQSQGKNLSKSLNRYHFQGLESITRLVLSGNGITDLPEDLFIDLKNLAWLDLRSNSVILKPGIFEHLSNLTILELGQNKISELPNGLFRHLSNLTQLNLWQNNLRNLSGDVFDGLNSLESLDLSTNNLISLPGDIFHKLPKLKNLNLLSNNFSSLPGNLFRSNPNLEYLRLVENKQILQELPGGLLNNLTKMKIVTLTKCKIEKLSESLFWGSTNIKNISFEGNNIKEIQHNLLKDQINLENLNFDRNKISKIHDDAFRTLKNLKVLNLNNNQLELLSESIFNHLDSLERLMIQHNNLQEISYNAFVHTPKLEYIDLSYNSLTLMEASDLSAFQKKDNILGLRSPFQFLNKVKLLNLSHNSLTEIFSDWRFNLLGLNHLDLSYNKYMKLTFPDVDFLSNSLTVDLRNNNISEINFKDALNMQNNMYPDAYHSGSRPAHNVTVLIENNPLHCDCTLYHFALYLDDKLDPQVRSAVTVLPGNVKCASPKNLEDRLFSQVRSQELLCPLDFPQSHFPPQCPQSCSCSVRPFDISLIMNCSDISDYIIHIPDARELGLKQTELHYENNRLVSLQELSKYQKSYNQITRLFVGGNNISRLSSSDIPRSIEILDLRKNQLEVVNSSVADFLGNSTTLSQIWISDNPFKCICENFNFFSFLQINYAKIMDFTNITCSDGQKISSLKLSDLCGTSPVLIAISIIVAITGLLVGIFIGLYYKYRLEVKVWLYSKDIWWGNEPDDDKLYDAFISYSHKDEEFITKTIVPRLEDSEHYKLCLHFRNWVPGEFIPTQIASSVEQSRRTLVVLSPNFLESVWGRMEFRTAHQRALKEGRARVVVVLYGDIGPTDNLDPELKAYLSMNTYVKWGDPWFWDKLKYALPHRKRSKNHSPPHSMLKKKGFDDKLELIHPTSPSTPPGQNTPPAHQAHSNPLMNHVNSYPNGLNGLKPPNLTNGTITMNGLRVNGNARHSDV